MRFVSRILLGRGRSEEPEWAVIATLVAALAVGTGLQSWVTSRTNTATSGRVSLAYPAAWVRGNERGTVISVSDVRSGGLFGTRAAVREVPKRELLGPDSAAGSVADAATAWSLTRGQGLLAYRVLDVAPAKVHGQDAYQLQYAYLATAPGGATSMPALMRAVDTLVASGDRFYVLTVAAENGEFDALAGPRFPRVSSVLDGLMAGWRVAG